MEQPDLDLRLSIFEGNRARIERLILFAHLRAGGDRPHRPYAEFLVLCRDESGCPPPWITRSAVTDRDVAWLVELLGAAGFPGRRPRITPKRDPLGIGLRLVFDVRLHRRVRSLDLDLESAGVSGPDAGSVRAVLQHLGGLAAAAGRPAVRAVLDRVVRERERGGERWPPHAGIPFGDRAAASGLANDSPDPGARTAGRDGERRSPHPAIPGSLVRR
jgi:hypothetical protein